MDKLIFLPTINGRSRYGPNYTPFGYAWHETLQAAYGFAITCSPSGIKKIRNIRSRDCVTEGVWRHSFILLPDEYVTEVGVIAKFTTNEQYKDSDSIEAIQIVTTHRKSQWYGLYNSKKVTQKISAVGCYIKNLRGRELTKSIGGDRDGKVVELGALFMPREQCPPMATPIEAFTFSSRVGLAKSETTFDRYGPQPPRAIIVNVPTTGGLDVRVVNTSELEYLDSIADHVYHDPHDHWFLLLENERIRGVEFQLCEIDGEVDKITAVQFETTLRTSSWFTSKEFVNDEGKWVSVTCDAKPEGTFVCGFRGTISTVSTAVESIEVVFFEPPTVTTKDDIHKSFDVKEERE